MRKKHLSAQIKAVLPIYCVFDRYWPHVPNSCKHALILLVLSSKTPKLAKIGIYAGHFGCYMSDCGGIRPIRSNISFLTMCWTPEVPYMMKSGPKKNLIFCRDSVFNPYLPTAAPFFLQVFKSPVFGPIQSGPVKAHQSIPILPN